MAQEIPVDPHGNFGDRGFAGPFHMIIFKRSVYGLIIGFYAHTIYKKWGMFSETDRISIMPPQMAVCVPGLRRSRWLSHERQSVR